MNILEYLNEFVDMGYREEDAEAAADMIFGEEPFEYDCGFEDYGNY